MQIRCTFKAGLFAAAMGLSVLGVAREGRAERSWYERDSAPGRLPIEEIVSALCDHVGSGQAVRCFDLAANYLLETLVSSPPVAVAGIDTGAVSDEPNEENTPEQIDDLINSTPTHEPY
jgi:hypothetical protein